MKIILMIVNIFTINKIYKCQDQLLNQQPNSILEEEDHQGLEEKLLF